jgi:tRNA threonylcarbamoyladenosine biosynthesis protein TsaE
MTSDNKPEPLMCFLTNEVETVAAGKQLGQLCRGGMVVFLAGTLGAGKTTLTRGVLQGLGHSGAVKSPTYTLVEPYESLSPVVYHFDLYRLGDPEELDYIGIRDYFSVDSLCLVEWADKGRDYLPEPDIIISLEPCQRNGLTGRQLRGTAQTCSGQWLLEQFAQSSK